MTRDVSAYPAEDIELPPHYVDTPEVRTAFARYLAEITVFDDQVGQCLDLISQDMASRRAPWSWSSVNKAIRFRLPSGLVMTRASRVAWWFVGPAR